MEVVRKTATITPTGSETDFPGTFEVILSAPTKDRDGDTLLPEEWKQPLPEHITFDIDHGMSVATTVGSGTPSIDAKTGNLVVRGTYSSLDRAQEVRTLVNEGHIRTTSVAFMNEPATVKNGKKVNQRELLNGAFVAVPSNREAVITNSKGLELKFNEDQLRDENGRFASGDSGSTASAPRSTNGTGIAGDAVSISRQIDKLLQSAQEDAMKADDVELGARLLAASGNAYSAHEDAKEAMGLAKRGDTVGAAEKLDSAASLMEETETVLAEMDHPAAQEAHSYVFEAADQLRTLANEYSGAKKSLDDYSTKSSSDSSNIDADVSEEAKSAEEVLKAAAHIAAAIEADSAEDADSVSMKAQAMNIIVEAFTSEN